MNWEPQCNRTPKTFGPLPVSPKFPNAALPTSKRNGTPQNRFLTTTPPFITNFTRSNSLKSCSGSPATAIRSANRSGFTPQEKKDLIAFLSVL